MKIEIRDYLDSSDRNPLMDMLVTCFAQDYKLSLTREQLEGWCNTLVRLAAEQIVFLDILTIDDIPQGFILSQVDSPQSDWCLKEGHGFIRELYVAAELRKAGHGKALVSHAENRLMQKGVPGIYLTTDEAMDFWARMGYRDSGEICLENNSPIFLK